MSGLSPILHGSPSASTGRESRSLESSLCPSARLIGDSFLFRKAIDRISRVAALDAPVLITGDTGTGKELAASRIHFLSKRSSGPLKFLNCAQPEDTLVESDLFGHEKGAFTGAYTPRPGLIAEAEGGTLVLDEINSLTPRAQGKLLRVLENKKVRRMGGNDEFPVDVRFIAVTNVSLESPVVDGTFRKDLYYRLSVLSVALPRLHDRRQDILALARHFLDENPLAGGAIATLTQEAAQALLSHDWPGNVRELRSAIIRGVCYCSGGRIEPGDLQIPPKEEKAFMTYKESKCAWEKRYLRDLMERHGGNISAAARAAKTERNFLKRRLDANGVADGPGSIRPRGSGGWTWPFEPDAPH